MAVVIVTPWSVGARVGVSADAAVEGAGTLAGCVAATGVTSRSGVAVGSSGPVAVGSVTVSVGCAGEVVGGTGEAPAGGGETGVSEGGITAVEVAGWLRANRVVGSSSSIST